MCVSVCVHVCVCACACVCVHVCVHVTSSCVCLHVCVLHVMCVHVHVCVCMCVFMLQVRVCVYMYVCCMLCVLHVMSVHVMIVHVMIVCVCVCVYHTIYSPLVPRPHIRLATITNLMCMVWEPMDYIWSGNQPDVYGLSVSVTSARNSFLSYLALIHCSRQTLQQKRTSHLLH